MSRRNGLFGILGSHGATALQEADPSVGRPGPREGVLYGGNALGALSRSFSSPKLPKAGATWWMVITQYNQGHSSGSPASGQLAGQRKHADPRLPEPSKSGKPLLDAAPEYTRIRFHGFEPAAACRFFR